MCGGGNRCAAACWGTHPGWLWFVVWLVVVVVVSVPQLGRALKSCPLLTDSTHARKVPVCTVCARRCRLSTSRPNLHFLASQVWNVVAGQLLSCAITLSVLLLFGPSVLSRALAMALSVSAMMLTDSVHPPGGEGVCRGGGEVKLQNPDSATHGPPSGGGYDVPLHQSYECRGLLTRTPKQLPCARRTPTPTPSLSSTQMRTRPTPAPGRCSRPAGRGQPPHPQFHGRLVPALPLPGVHTFGHAPHRLGHQLAQAQVPLRLPSNGRNNSGCCSGGHNSSRCSLSGGGSGISRSSARTTAARRGRRERQLEGWAEAEDGLRLHALDAWHYLRSDDNGDNGLRLKAAWGYLAARRCAGFEQWIVTYDSGVGAGFTEGASQSSGMMACWGHAGG